MPVTAATGGEQPPLGSQHELGASAAVNETAEDLQREHAQQ